MILNFKLLSKCLMVLYMNVGLFAAGYGIQFKGECITFTEKLVMKQIFIVVSSILNIVYLRVGISAP